MEMHSGCNDMPDKICKIQKVQIKQFDIETEIQCHLNHSNQSHWFFWSVGNEHKPDYWLSRLNSMRKGVLIINSLLFT